MRVLRTDFIFDRSQVDVDHDPPDFPAISCAWFKIDEGDVYTRRLPSEFPAGTPLAYSEGGLAPLVDGPTTDQIRAFVSLSLYDIFYEGEEDFGTVTNARVVDWVLDQSIVIEESPPKAVPLKTLIGGSTTMTIGAMVGYGAAPSAYPLLLLITVPMGIIVVGSAAAIAVGIQHGLHELVKQKFNEWKKKPKAR